MPEEFRDSVEAGGGNPLNDAIDLGTVGAAVAPEPERKPGKRRGRPPGSGGKSSGTGKEKVKGAVDLSSLTGMFVGLHVMAASSLNVPELSMDMEEGTQFMKSAQNVMRHYSVETTQKTLDWIAFSGTCCMLYGTRFGAYMLRKKSEREPQPQTVAYQVAPRQPSPPNKTPQQPVSQEQHFPVEIDFEGD